ncbi:hypothetical protein KC361_g41 [Hortaea werneckii]|nr:hypothetical protein KC361_g41 [Hortaea werneckii]
MSRAAWIFLTLVVIGSKRRSRCSSLSQRSYEATTRDPEVQVGTTFLASGRRAFHPECVGHHMPSFRAAPTLAHVPI